jgi:hypothetical protein
MVPGDRIAPRVYSDSACRWPHDRVATNGNASKGKRRPSSWRRKKTEPL